jgi:hypothetical protein
MGHLASFMKFAEQLALQATLRSCKLFSKIHRNLTHQKTHKFPLDTQGSWRII